MVTTGMQDAVPAPWADSAIADTVAAIARTAPYAREFRQSLIDRFWTWLNDWIRYLVDLLPDWHISGWVVVILAVALVALALLRIGAGRRAVAEWEAGGHGGVASRRGDAWRDAQALAAAGDHTAAAHALLAALLGAMAARGEVKLHPSKTTGDYARELRRRSSGHASGFQRFRTRYDRVIFGDGHCTPDQYDALLGEARPLLVMERAA